MNVIVRLTRRLLPLLFVMAMAMVPVSAAGPAQSTRWEAVDTIIAELSDDAFDVTVRENYIYVYTPRSVNVKLFTILGQLVNQNTLQPGTSRLRMNARGIYILKAGTITRRVTL